MLLLPFVWALPEDLPLSFLISVLRNEFARGDVLLGTLLWLPSLPSSSAPSAPSVCARARREELRPRPGWLVVFCSGPVSSPRLLIIPLSTAAALARPLATGDASLWRPIFFFAFHLRLPARLQRVFGFRATFRSSVFFFETGTCRGLPTPCSLLLCDDPRRMRRAERA